MPLLKLSGSQMGVKPDGGRGVPVVLIDGVAGCVWAAARPTATEKTTITNISAQDLFFLYLHRRSNLFTCVGTRVTAQHDRESLVRMRNAE